MGHIGLLHIIYWYCATLPLILTPVCSKTMFLVQSSWLAKHEKATMRRKGLFCVSVAGFSVGGWLAPLPWACGIAEHHRGEAWRSRAVQLMASWKQLWHLFYKVMNYLPEAPPPNIITLEIRLQYMNFRGPIHSIAGEKLNLLLKKEKFSFVNVLREFYP